MYIRQLINCTISKFWFSKRSNFCKGVHKIKKIETIISKSYSYCTGCVYKIFENKHNDGGFFFGDYILK